MHDRLYFTALMPTFLGHIICLGWDWDSQNCKKGRNFHDYFHSAWRVLNVYIKLRSTEICISFPVHIKHNYYRALRISFSSLPKCNFPYTSVSYPFSCLLFCCMILCVLLSFPISMLNVFKFVINYSFIEKQFLHLH